LTLSSYRSTSASHFVLYGSSDHCLLPSFPTRRSSDLEAVGGLINIITKNPRNSPILAVDAFGTGWGELSADIAAKIQVGNKVQSLLGVSYFNYQNPIDNNNDNFTDVTLQHRISLFNKWNI